MDRQICRQIEINRYIGRYIDRCMYRYINDMYKDGQPINWLMINKQIYRLTDIYKQKDGHDVRKITCRRIEIYNGEINDSFTFFTSFLRLLCVLRGGTGCALGGGK